MSIEDLIKEGDKVHYIAPHAGAQPENGIVKEVAANGKTVVVVFNCNGNWDNFRDYTGKRCYTNSVAPGWENKSLNLFFVGDEFYEKSRTSMSSVYETITKKRSGWVEIKNALRDGFDVHIRQATGDEMDWANRMLNELQKQEQNEKIDD